MELPLGIDISNVMLWDELQNLASRTGSKQVEGKKRRYFIKSKNLVEEA
jgi:ribosomal protein L24